MNPSILITGAAGFVGKHLATALRLDGYQVTAMVRGASRIDYLQTIGADIMRADLKDKDSILRSFPDGIQAVVHLASTMTGPWEEYELSTVLGTRRLVEVALQKNVKKFIYISSIAVYALEQGKNTIDEYSPLETAAPTHYEKSKIMAEKMVREHKGERLKFTILRPGVIYGPGGVLFPPRLGYARGNNFYVIGDGNNKIPLVYVEHLVDAIKLALGNSAAENKTFNVVDDPQISQNHYLEAVSRDINRQLKVTHVPHILAAGVGGAVGLALKLLGKPNPLRRKYLDQCVRPLKYSNKEIKRVLGWKTRLATETALAQTMAAFM